MASLNDTFRRAVQIIPRSFPHTGTCAHVCTCSLLCLREARARTCVCSMFGRQRAELENPRKGAPGRLGNGLSGQRMQRVCAPDFPSERDVYAPERASFSRLPVRERWFLDCLDADATGLILRGECGRAFVFGKAIGYVLCIVFGVRGRVLAFGLRCRRN